MSDAGSQQIPEATDVQVKEEETTTLPSPVSSVVQTGPNTETPSPTRIRRTEGQRRAILRNDPLIQELEPERVLCRVCQKWIKLSSTVHYGIRNWHSHKQRCRGSPSVRPSSRVATAERQIVLLNDSQVKMFSQKFVQCAKCMSVVALGDDIDYELTNWIEHKGKCIPVTPAPITPQGSASHRPRVAPPSTLNTSSSGSQRSPTSIGEGSVETTAVTESSPAAVKVGTKRRREEEESEDEEDGCPRNRPRTETCTRPEKDAPSVLGWFMQPLKEFARGFREGLGST